MSHDSPQIRRARNEVKHAERSLAAAIPGTFGHAMARERLDAAAIRYIALTGVGRIPAPVGAALPSPSPADPH